MFYIVVAAAAAAAGVVVVGDQWSAGGLVLHAAEQDMAVLILSTLNKLEIYF